MPEARKIAFPAIRFHQNDVRMYVGTLRAEDLLGLGQVDEWHKDGNVQSGYQRAPERSRARAVAKYLTSSKKALLPTSVLLSYRGDMTSHVTELDGDVVKVALPTDTVLWEVDGQHRLAGLAVAIEENGEEELRDYLVPLVIMEGLSETEEANQFRVINETAKKVRTDLARRILLQAAQEAGGRAEVAKMGRMWEVRATEVIDHLLSDPRSPWRERIQRPNQKRQKLQTVKELSFSNSLKPIVDSFPYSQYSPEKTGQLLIEYWLAWQALIPEAFDEPRDYVLLKTPGVFSLHRVAPYLVQVCQENGLPLEADQFAAILSDLGEYAEARYWATDNIEGASAFGSMKGFGILADLMIGALQDKDYVLA